MSRFLKIIAVCSLIAGSGDLLAKESQKPTDSLFQPHNYLQYREFEKLKLEEQAASLLRYRILVDNDVKYLKLQSEKGAILLPVHTRFSKEDLNTARCTETETEFEPLTILTKLEYDLSKAVKERVETLLSVIEDRCARYQAGRAKLQNNNATEPQSVIYQTPTNPNQKSWINPAAEKLYD